MRLKWGLPPIPSIILIASIAVGAVGYFVLAKPPAENPTPGVHNPSTQAPNNNRDLTSPPSTNIRETSNKTLWFVPATSTKQRSLVPEKFQDQVSFLRGGEVWLAGDDGSNPIQLTHTGGTAYSYSVSPRLSYLEYLTLEKSTERRTDINVLELNSGQIKTLTNPKSIPRIVTGDMHSGGTWFSDTLLYMGNLGGHDKYYHPFVVDVRGTSTGAYPLPPIPASTEYAKSVGIQTYSLIVNGISVAAATADSVIQLEGALILYERDGAAYDPSMGSEGNEGDRLKEFHVLNTATGQDKLVATASENIEGAALSHGGDKIALTGLGFEERLGLNPRIPDQPFKVLVYPSTLLYGGNSSEYDLQWSFDDRFLAFRDAEKADGLVLVDIASSANRKVVNDAEPDGVHDSPPIVNFQWTRENGIMFERGGDIYLYKPQTDTTVLFSASSSYPFVF